MNRKRFFSLAGIALMSLATYAVALEINVTEPGTFKDLVIDSEGDISTLVVKGTLDASDVEYLIGNTGKITQVKHLDLSDMKLVESETVPYRRVNIFSEAGGGEFAYCYYSPNVRVEATYSTGGLGMPITTYHIYGPDMTGLLADTGFEKVTLPASVSCVADYMCLRALNLEEVVVPENASRIGVMAFKQTNLKSIELPATIESIGNSAFEWTQLTSVALPPALTQIGTQAFRICDQLETINLENVKELGDGAFQGDGKIKSADLRNVARVGTQAFLDCPLGELILSDNLKVIGDQAFALAYAEMKKYAKLTALRLPEGLDSIGREAFLNTNLEEVTVPSSVEYIGNRAFEGTPWDKTLRNTAVDNVIYLGDIAYKVINKPETVIFRDGTKSVAASVDLSEVKNLTLPTSCKSFYAQGELGYLEKAELGTGLITIGDNCFQWANKLTSITLPETLESIGSGAFNNAGLTSLSLPEGLKSIGDSGSYNAPSTFGNMPITSITLPENLEYIGYGAFSGCQSLSLVRLNSRNLKAGEFSYYGSEAHTACLFMGSGVEKIIIGSAVESIPDGMFERVYPSRIEFEESSLPLKIGDVALRGSYEHAKLKGSIDRVTSIGKYGLERIDFSGASLDFPNLVTIKKHALNDISGVRAITLGAQVQNVSASAIQSVEGLMTFKYDIPEAELQDVNNWEISLMPNVEVDSIIIGSNVRLIPDNLLQNVNCNTLVFEPRETTRTASSLSIGANAFQFNYNLYCVDFPIDLLAVGERAFDECTQLNTVYFHSEVAPAIGENALNRTSTVYVPAEAEQAYQAEMPTNRVQPYRLESLLFDKSALNLQVGDFDYLIARIEPAECSEMSNEWTSSDPSVATVNSRGDVIALKEGKTVITATIVFDSSFKAECLVTVSDDAAVEEIGSDADDSPIVEYYRIDGSIVKFPTASGIYIGRKANGKSVKIIVK